MTKIPSRKPSGTYGHGPLKICFWKGKDDDHDQDFLKKRLANGFGFFGPRIAFPATGALRGRATPFFYHFSVHLSSVLGRTELCHEVWTPGPPKPQIIRNENHHLALLETHNRICTAPFVKRRSSPARGYKFGCVCSYMAGHYPGILMTGHIGTNTPKFVPLRCNFGCFPILLAKCSKAKNFITSRAVFFQPRG